MLMRTEGLLYLFGGGAHFCCSYQLVSTLWVLLDAPDNRGALKLIFWAPLPPPRARRSISSADGFQISLPSWLVFFCFFRERALVD